MLGKLSAYAENDERLGVVTECNQSFQCSETHPINASWRPTHIALLKDLTGAMVMACVSLLADRAHFVCLGGLG